MDEWINTNVLVTGAASGIGAATSLLLAAQGARVTGFDRDGPGLARIAARARGLAGAFESLTGDVTVATDRRRAVDLSAGDLGRIDLLVNNAAVFLLAGIEATTEQWQRTFDVNLLAPASLVSDAVQNLSASSRAAVVNITSISAHIAQAGRWTYNSAKAGLLELTKCQAMDLMPHGIRVNSVSPGWIWTETLEEAAADDRPKWEPIWGSYCLMGRCGEPVEVARAIAFLGGPAASFITGADLSVDGGYLAMGNEGGAVLDLER